MSFTKKKKIALKMTFSLSILLNLYFLETDIVIADFIYIYIYI
jgi:hypothetical protein